ncbi:hypothetical protein [uncultured Jatrophihabitans sp.]|uniref:hypothetical protein n=1 Tax=uncultured Jatrophihabitans sp. TaxID=1610747 RepID=UPI0035CC0682
MTDETEGRVRPRRRDDDGPVLPDVTRDELDEGWGDGRAAGDRGRDADWYRRERPPHHE